MPILKILRSDKALLYVYITILVLIRLIHIMEMQGPVIMYDEAGYWSHAANIFGLSWVKAEPAWYSYGYSLLLVPLFFFTHDMVLLYQLAIIENIILGVIGFIICNKIIRMLEPECTPVFSLTVSFIASCYSSYLFQSQIGWAETFIYIWFLVVLWRCLAFLKKEDVMNSILFSFSASFLYIIHNRNLPILLALGFFYLALFGRNRFIGNRFLR